MGPGRWAQNRAQRCEAQLSGFTSLSTILGPLSGPRKRPQNEGKFPPQSCPRTRPSGRPALRLPARLPVGPPTRPPPSARQRRHMNRRIGCSGLCARREAEPCAGEVSNAHQEGPDGRASGGMGGWAEREGGGRCRRVVGRGGCSGSLRRKREFHWACLLRALRAVLRVPFVPPLPRPPGRDRSSRHVGGPPSSCGAPAGCPNSCGRPAGRPSSCGGPGGLQRKEVAGGCHRTVCRGGKVGPHAGSVGDVLRRRVVGTRGPRPCAGF